MKIQWQVNRTYGARRIWHDVLAEGFNLGLHRIERLVRENAMRSRPRRRNLPSDAYSVPREQSDFTRFEA